MVASPPPGVPYPMNAFALSADGQRVLWRQSFRDGPEPYVFHHVLVVTDATTDAVLSTASSDVVAPGWITGDGAAGLDGDQLVATATGAVTDLAGDVAAVAAALDDGPIVLAGHDWGAPIVWNTAVRHPDRVRAVAGLSVPYTPPMALSLLDLFDQLYADRFFYMLYFREPGVAEAAFGADLRAALKRCFFALSGDAPANCWVPDAPRDAAFLPLLPEPPDGGPRPPRAREAGR